MNPNTNPRTFSPQLVNVLLSNRAPSICPKIQHIVTAVKYGTKVTVVH